MDNKTNISISSNGAVDIEQKSDKNENGVSLWRGGSVEYRKY